MIKNKMMMTYSHIRCIMRITIRTNKITMKMNKMLKTIKTMMMIMTKMENNI